MATESLQLSETFPAPPERVWRAWLDSKEHTEMTGAETSIQPAVGATFQASDGYIVGMNVELEPYRRIVQTWRTTEFPPGAPHSRLEIVLDQEAEGTRLTLNHSEIPEGQADRYRDGWRDYYFMPMKDYFEAHGEKKAGNEIIDAAVVESFKVHPEEAPAEEAPVRPAKPKKEARDAAAVKRAIPAKAAAPAKAQKTIPARSVAAAKKAAGETPAAKKPAAKKAAPTGAASKRPAVKTPAKKAAASKASPAKKAKAPKAASSAKAKAPAKKASASGRAKTAAKPAAPRKAATKSKRR